MLMKVPPTSSAALIIKNESKFGEMDATISKMLATLLRWRLVAHYNGVTQGKCVTTKCTPKSQSLQHMQIQSTIYWL